MWRRTRRSPPTAISRRIRSEEHTSELQSQSNLVCRLLLEKKKQRELDLRRHHQQTVEDHRPEISQGRLAPVPIFSRLGLLPRHTDATTPHDLTGTHLLHII